MSIRDESNAEYFSRRALEENRIAQGARTKRAVAAHRHIAVAYALRLAEELKLERALDELLIALDAAAHYSLETPAPVSDEALVPGAGVVIGQVGQDGRQIAA